jgi:hypothetical protein
MVISNTSGIPESTMSLTTRPCLSHVVFQLTREKIYMGMNTSLKVTFAKPLMIAVSRIQNLKQSVGNY